MSKLTKKQEKKRQLRQRERAKKDPAALAYHGNKYRTAELVTPLMQTESAIFQAYVASGRQLTDHDVCRALVGLIGQLRRGAVPAQDGSPDEPLVADGPCELVVQFAHLTWKGLAADGGHPGRDNLIGIVRTILASVEARKSVNPQSRNYLQFIEGFLGKLGVHVDRIPASNVIDVEASD